MIISLKDSLKLLAISIVVACAVFVCTLFLNYNIDLASIKNTIISEEAQTMYDAQVSMGRVTAIISGCCLVITSVIMLIFYIKNYIDSHGKELGILKAMGYPNFTIAKHFWIFGLSVLLGCILGYIVASCYLPTFYKVQNAEGLFMDLKVEFHLLLCILETIIPTLIFMVISVFYANSKLKKNALDLIKEKTEYKYKLRKKEGKERSFLKELTISTLTSRKTFIFLVAFSAFCFSAMIQMAISMNDIASSTFSYMIITMGLIIAFMAILMALSSVVKGNRKTIAMMRVFGYDYFRCSNAIVGAYRPISYVGFAIGTVYQYAILKISMTFIIKDIVKGAEYHFNVLYFFITLISFIITYELIMFLYSLKIKKMSLKSIMLE